MNVVLAVHVAAGFAGLASGFVALLSTKGGPTHVRAGVVFVVSMLAMSGIGAALAAFRLGADAEAAIELTVCVGVLTAYLVATGYTTFRDIGRRGAGGLLLLGGAAGAACYALAGAALVQGGVRNGLPPQPYLLFGSIAWLAVAGDVRLALGRRLDGRQRLARHLWRVCVALAIASMSFFVGQSDLFPEWLRITPLLIAPTVIVLLVMAWWLGKLRWRRHSGVARPQPAGPLSGVNRMRVSKMGAGAAMLLVLATTGCASARGVHVAELAAAADGQRVRVRLSEQSRAVEGAAEPQLLRGSLVRLTADTLLLRVHPAAGVTAVARSGIERLDVSRGVRSRLESAAVNGATFAALGALERVLFAALDDDRYDGETTWESAALGAAGGALIGIVTGALFPQERWARVRDWRGAE